MKNNISILFSTILLGLVTIAKANEVNVIIVNYSNYSIYGSTSDVRNGSFLVHDGPSLSRAEVKKGSTARFSTGQALPFCGTDGYVFYKAVANGKEYFINIQFDVPYIGENEFYHTADAPFRIKHVVGGPGSNVTITYELTGGPTEIIPNAPPINLPTKGTAWYTGNINWNSNNIGLPEEDVLEAFDFEVTAPTKFYPNYPANNNPNFTGGSISPSSGTFTDYKPLPNIKAIVKKNETSSNERFEKNVYSISLNYSVNNLPNNIPLEIRVTPKNSFWQKGNATPSKPQTNVVIKWTVFAEQIKNIQGNGNFKINGVWANAQGLAVGLGDETNGLGRKLLSKQVILIKQDVTIFGNDVLKIPGVALNQKVRQQSSQINTQIKPNVNVRRSMIKQ